MEAVPAAGAPPAHPEPRERVIQPLEDGSRGRPLPRMGPRSHRERRLPGPWTTMPGLIHPFWPQKPVAKTAPFPHSAQGEACLMPKYTGGQRSTPCNPLVQTQERTLAFKLFHLGKRVPEAQAGRPRAARLWASPEEDHATPAPRPTRPPSSKLGLPSTERAPGLAVISPAAHDPDARSLPPSFCSRHQAPTRAKPLPVLTRRYKGTVPKGSCALLEKKGG